MPDNKDALLEEARDRFTLVCDVEEKQRERERLDLEFQVPEFQWDEGARKARAGGDGTPPRPILSISKLDQPRQLILNQMRQADLGVQVHPISEEADQETAEMIQGLYRHIERKSHAELARYWAFDRAVTAGRGAYRVLTEYDDEGGDPSDQRIVIKRILHQEGVYLDPAATEPDYSDGRFAFVVAWMTRDEFKRQFPKSRASLANMLEWSTLEQEAPEWVREDDVLVAEYWYKVYEPEEFSVEGEKRTRDKVVVKVCKMSGWEVLEESQTWPGKYIPIIPTIGRELQPFDEERRFVGMIASAKDGQRLYNFAASTLVERMALEPKAPFMVDVKTIEGYEQFWDQANTRNFPYLPYNSMIGGQVLPAPVRAQIDSSGMSIAMMALQEADQFIQATTAVFDPSLGRLPQKERSGRAIMALQQQADAGTSHFIQNLADISMVYEAKVVLDLIPKIYDRPGRVTQIVRGDDQKASAVMLNAPFVMDPRTKRPIPAPPGMPGMPPPPNVKTYDLSKGVYSVSVNIGKAFQTRLQEGSERIGELLANKPELFMMMGDLFLRFQDWPGAHEMAERMAKVRERQFPGLGEGEDGVPPPEQVQAQMQGMQQQMQQMGQQLQMAMQAMETEQAKQQASIAKAQLEAQTRMSEAQMERDTKLRISAADNETKLALAGMEAKMAALLELLTLEREAAKAERAAEEAREDRTHEVVMGELGQPAPEEPEMEEAPRG